MARGVERFLTTVLMTDIVGSTEHAAELGDRGWRDLVHMHHAIVRAALRRYGGREVDTAGDGFFCVFDAPAAALGCALDVARDVRELGVEIRAGLHVGEVEEIAGKVGGITVPIAARIMGSAGPGEVIVSATVRDLAAGAGLQFADRGVRELKGVPGEWRTFLAARPADVQQAARGTGVAAGSGSSADPAVRRATAVRRMQSRPIWMRRRRLTVAVTVVLAVAVSGVGLLVWSPWRAPALAGIGENSVGIIDSDRNELVYEFDVGTRPAAIAYGEGAVWAVNTGSDTVSRIDPRARAVVDTIDTGRQPAGIAVGNGSVWVTNTGSRSVSRIDAASGRVVDEIAVGNAPGAIAYGAAAIWVANSADGTVTRVDHDTGAAGEPISVGLAPSAIAVDETGLWVASRESAVVTRLDPRTGAAVAAPIAVGSRPVALAIAGGSVWVANAGDRSVSRVDIQSNRVTATTDVNGPPLGLGADDRAVWVAVQDGTVQRIDPAAPARPAARIAIGAAPQAIALVDGQPWLVTRASAASHRGGTLRVVADRGYSVDPASFPTPELRSLFGDGLVGYRREGGIAGSTLMPNLATSLPRPTEGGRVYTFSIRPGIVYADGSPVRATDFRTAIERSIRVEDVPGFGSRGASLFSEIVGVEDCTGGPEGECDLSAGIQTDDSAGTVTFRLTRPDPDFLAKLALDPAYPVPAGSVPMDAFSHTGYPATGPYMIESASETEIRLVRNPHFRSWDTSVRPDGNPDEIVWTIGPESPEQLELVRTGRADHMTGFIPPEAFDTLRTQHTSQLQVATQATTFLFMNTQMAPFDRLEVRQAVNLAIDRAHVAELRGGAFAATITCQVLPPNFPGYRPYCPWTADPDPGQRWKGPDMAAARRLVAESGTGGMSVPVGPFIERMRPVGEYVVTVLDDLGYDATMVTVADNDAVYTEVFEGRVGISGFAYIQEYPAPDTFFAEFTCENAPGLSNHCDPDLDALIEEARALQSTDPAQASAQWAAVDRRIVDLGLWAPLVNEGTQFVSERFGNYQFHPHYGILLDQAWVQ